MPGVPGRVRKERSRLLRRRHGTPDILRLQKNSRPARVGEDCPEQAVLRLERRVQY